MEVSIHTLFARTLEHSDSLVGSIAESIGRAIIEGSLYPGDDLNTVDLSKQFNTSRTPVREALLLLEKKGLVTISPYRRPYVARMSLVEAHEIYQVRAHLHMLVSELIIAQASDEDIHLLRVHLNNLQEAIKAEDSDAYFWQSLSFRETETTICGNSQLQQTLASFGFRILQLRYRSLTPPGRLGQSYHDHVRLVQAYEERDAPLAGALTRSLILGAFAAIEHSNWPNEPIEKILDQLTSKK